VEIESISGTCELDKCNWQPCLLLVAHMLKEPSSFDKCLLSFISVMLSRHRKMHLSVTAFKMLSLEQGMKDV
jgi:hypothetical protein